MICPKIMAPYSSTLAWKIPWMQEPGRLQSMGLLGVRHNWGLHFHFSLSCVGKGNVKPLQCSCLENPRDGEAWWAAVYGVAQSWTWLKWLSSSSSNKLMRGPPKCFLCCHISPAYHGTSSLPHHWFSPMMCFSPT